MDLAAVTDGLSAVALAIALAACAGLRAWLPLFLAGVFSRFGLLELGGPFRILGSNKALVLFAVATLLEFLGDKVPAVDHALDLLGTLLRPAAGALLAASVLGHLSDPLTAVVLGTALGAPAALIPHAAKSALRAASTTLTAGVANPALSLIEDGVTLALFVLAVVVPIVVIALLGIAVVLLARRFSRSRSVVPAA